MNDDFVNMPHICYKELEHGALYVLSHPASVSDKGHLLIDFDGMQFPLLFVGRDVTKHYFMHSGGICYRYYESSSSWFYLLSPAS